MKLLQLALLLVATSSVVHSDSFVVREGYPSRALREGREGTAWFTVDVTVDGRAENCMITQSTGSEDLDQATCANVIQRARFNPALDASGKPMRGRYSGKMAWKIRQ